MSAAHTPGPWEFVQAGSGDFPTWNVRIGDRGFIRLPATADMDVMDADARLIAAAPELLEALRSIADCCDEEHAARDYASRQTEIRGIARAAIAKSEGC